MRFVIWLIVLFVAATVAASWLGTNDALVSFHIGYWRLDVSLNFFLLCLALLVAVLVTGTRTTAGLLALPARARDWRELKRERSAQQALRLAQIEWMAARYARAQRWALQALELQSESPALSADKEFSALAHLFAAGSMHKLQDRNGRDKHLDAVLHQTPAGSALDGARLQAAEWALEDRDASRAQQLMADLPPGVARRTQALRLRLQAARLRRQPAEALQVARLLAKHQGFRAEAGVVLVRTLAQETLDQALDEAQLRQAWLALEERERSDPWVAARAARVAARLQAPEHGVRWLRELWTRADSWNADERAALAGALVECRRALSADWLPLLEASLQAHGREPAVVALVGIGYAQRQLWGKARPLLMDAGRSEALDAKMRRQAWRQLAEIERAAGRESEARDCEVRAAQIE